MDKNCQDWLDEVQYLENTKRVLQQKIEKLNYDITKSKETVEDLRKYYIDGTQVFGDFDDAEKVTVNQIINENIDLANNNIDKVNALERNKARPYFGRVDFVSKDDDVKAYIGLTGIDDSNDYYVIDWRAPIAELFYEAGKGKASIQLPEGKCEGEVTLKRQYDIASGELIDAFDVDADIFDEYLQKVLSKVNSEHLHNIAGTIQKEQNEIIRNLRDDLIVVQGYSGSGKTTVALHRIAYALYRLRDLKSANILLFTLNEAFLSHIDGVLPELGEQNTRSATLSKFASRLLKITREFEENDEFLDRFVQANEAERDLICQKLDLGIKEKIRAFADDFTNTRVASSGFKIENKAFTAEMLNQMYNSLTEDKVFTRLNKIAATIIKKLKVEKFATVKRIITSKIYEVFDVPHSPEELYGRFCEANGWAIPSATDKVHTEDVILMCLLKEATKELIIRMDIRHIVIDEVQEYPLLFVDLLLRLFPRAQFSIFGDKYQRTNPTGIKDLGDIIALDAIFGTSKMYTLDNTYRSSEEIVEYCSGLIGNPRHNVFRYSNGEAVEEQILGDDITQVASQIVFALEKAIHSHGSIGIITGDISMAKKIYNILSPLCPHRLSLVDSAESSALENIQIVPVGMCKGLEFNTVIVVEDGGLFDSFLGENLKYIACTRAINKLYVFQKGENK